METAVVPRAAEGRAELLVEHVAASAVVELLAACMGRHRGAVVGAAALRQLADEHDGTRDAVVAWRGALALAAGWTVRTAAAESERLMLVELAPRSGDAIESVVRALLPGAKGRGVRVFEITLPSEVNMVEKGLHAAGLAVLSQMFLGGASEVRLGLP